MQEKISEPVTGLITEEKYPIYTKYTIVLTFNKKKTGIELCKGLSPVTAFKR